MVYLCYFYLYFDTLNTKYKYHNRYEELRNIEKSLAKSILILRIAMNRIGEIIGEYKDNWLLHESFMEERNALHSQIDLAMKKKRKLVRLMSNSTAMHLPN